VLTLVAGTVKSKAGCRRSIYLKPCCRPLPAVLCLQVKPLEGSLANVNGRGCNESAAGEEEAAPAPGHESLLCAAARAAAAITLLSAHPPATQRPAPQLFRLPSCACHAHCPAGASHALPACLPAEEGHAVAKEQYCEPIEWYSGQHAACFAKVQLHYRGDALSLRFGEVSTATI
jgi:hypothetical protein